MRRWGEGIRLTVRLTVAPLRSACLLPFCLGLMVGFSLSLALGAAEKIFTLYENSCCIM